MEESKKRKDELKKKPFSLWNNSTLRLRLMVWSLFILFIVAEALVLRAVATLKVLDARFAYSPVEGMALIKSLDTYELLAYRVFNLVDFVLIILYSILLVTWFRLLAPDVDIKLHSWPWVGLLPGIFDFIETLGVAILLNNKQSIQKWAIWLGVIGTPLKWIGAVIVLLLLVFAEIRGLQHRLREGRPWYDLSPPSYNTPISNSVPKELS